MGGKQIDKKGYLFTGFDFLIHGTKGATVNPRGKLAFSGEVRNC